MKAASTRKERPAAKPAINEIHEPDNGHVHGPGCNHAHDLVCDLRIRLYTPEDHKELTLVWKSCDIALDDTDSARAIAQNLKRNGDGYRIFVAEAQMTDKKSNKPVGEAHIAGGVIATFDGHRMYVYHLAVHSQFRSVGLGQALLETCENQARLWGARHMRLTSRTDASRAAARKMYVNAGWNRDESVWVYVKTLTAKPKKS